MPRGCDISPPSDNAAVRHTRRVPSLSRRTTTTLLLSSALLLAACSSDEPTPDAGPALPSADVCEQVGATEVPAECLPDGNVGRRTPTAPPPPGVTSAFPPLQVEPIDGELARADNNTEADRTTQTLTVTVRKGNRLGIQAACEGFSTFVAATTPESEAAFEFDCGFEGDPTELGVETSTPVEADTTFTVTVGAPAPARWAAVVYETDEPLVDPAV